MPVPPMGKRTGNLVLVIFEYKSFSFATIAHAVCGFVRWYIIYILNRPCNFCLLNKREDDFKEREKIVVFTMYRNYKTSGEPLQQQQPQPQRLVGPPSGCSAVAGIQPKIYTKKASRISVDNCPMLLIRVYSKRLETKARAFRRSFTKK